MVVNTIFLNNKSKASFNLKKAYKTQDSKKFSFYNANLTTTKASFDETSNIITSNNLINNSEKLE